MFISSQGFGHFQEGINNQDFGMETPRMLLVLDGCSAGKYSEIGTRLFVQLFSRKEEFDKLDKFENNVKEIFDLLITMMRPHYSNLDVFENEFILENLLFTIIACFKTKDKFIVKIFGDGYIISQNMEGLVSYMRFSYGKYPPYYGYKYCQNMQFQDYQFKTFEFDRKLFKTVGIATDGVLPIVKGGQKNKDNLICNGDDLLLKKFIVDNRHLFYDDVTIGMFAGGKKDE